MEPQEGGEGTVASSQYARVRMRKALRERLVEDDISNPGSNPPQDSRSEHDFPNRYANDNQSHPRRELQMARARARRRDRGRGEPEVEVYYSQHVSSYSNANSNRLPSHANRYHRQSQQYSGQQHYTTHLRDSRARTNGGRQQPPSARSIPANQSGSRDAFQTSHPAEAREANQWNRHGTSSSAPRTPLDANRRGAPRDQAKAPHPASAQCSSTTIHQEQQSLPTECSRIRAKFRLSEGVEQSMPPAVPPKPAEVHKAEAEVVTLEDLIPVPREPVYPNENASSPRHPFPPNPPSAPPPIRQLDRYSPRAVPTATVTSPLTPKSGFALEANTPSKLRAGLAQAAMNSRQFQDQPVPNADPPLQSAPAPAKPSSRPPVLMITQQTSPTTVPADTIVSPQVSHLQMLMDSFGASEVPTAQHLQLLSNAFMDGGASMPSDSPLLDDAPSLLSLIHCHTADGQTATELQLLANAFQDVTLAQPRAAVSPPSALQQICTADPDFSCVNLNLILGSTLEGSSEMRQCASPKKPTTTESVWEPYEDYIYARMKLDKEAALRHGTEEATSQSSLSGPAPEKASAKTGPPSSASPSIPFHPCPAEPPPIPCVQTSTHDAHTCNGRQECHPGQPQVTHPVPHRFTSSPHVAQRSQAMASSPAKSEGRSFNAREMYRRRHRSNSSSASPTSQGILPATGLSMCGPAVRRRDWEYRNGTQPLSKEDLDRASGQDGFRIQERTKEKGRIVRQWIDAMVGRC